MTIYATTDSDGGFIGENAKICAFSDVDSAHAYLMQAYEGGLDEGEGITFQAGYFGDCWIKTTVAPEGGLDPFDLDDLIIIGPGAHPGGPYFWITPGAEILTATTVYI